MTSTEQRLRQAAEKIHAHAEAAHSENWGNRPWHIEECGDTDEGSCACIVAQGVGFDPDQPQATPTEYIADAELTVYADWIALMHPGVGEALAAWLVFEADLIARAPHTETRPRSDHALALADAILGTPDEGGVE